MANIALQKVDFSGLTTRVVVELTVKEIGLLLSRSRLVHTEQPGFVLEVRLG